MLPSLCSRSIEKTKFSPVGLVKNISVVNNAVHIISPSGMRNRSGWSQTSSDGGLWRCRCDLRLSGLFIRVVRQSRRGIGDYIRDSGWYHSGILDNIKRWNKDDFTSGMFRLINDSFLWNWSISKFKYGFDFSLAKCFPSISNHYNNIAPCGVILSCLHCSAFCADICSILKFAGLNGFSERIPHGALLTVEKKGVNNDGNKNQTINHDRRDLEFRKTFTGYTLVCFGAIWAFVGMWLLNITLFRWLYNLRRQGWWLSGATSSLLFSSVLIWHGLNLVLK